MAVLCMDNEGRIYVASRDKADGSGVESIPAADSDYGANLYQNPYLETSNAALKEAKMLQETQVMADAQSERAMIQKKKVAAHALRSQNASLEKSEKQKNELLAEGVMQGFHGNADFNELHIVDENYGKVHAAALQGLGYRPSMGDTPLLKDVQFSNQLELSQAALNDKYIKEVITQNLKDQVFYKSEARLSVLPESTIDKNANALLIGEGEMYFDTEDEAKAFQKLNAVQQSSYQSKGAEYLPDSNAPVEDSSGISSKAKTIAAIAAALYLLFK